MRKSKRIFDLFWAILGLIILSPFLLLIALIIKLDDSGPIFFRQKRVGYKGKCFNIIKFRTMVKDAKKIGFQLTIGRDNRITRLGSWLRKYKLDELPQLFNVIAGEMSLVGPRPEVPHYVKLYTVEQKRILDLMPGITDPASIKFRHENEILAGSNNPDQTYIDKIIPEKIQLNWEYSSKSSIGRDFYVILHTLILLLK